MVALPIQPKPPAKELTPLVAVEPPPVQPDQVNDANAKQAFDALRDELDNASNESPTPGGRKP